MVDVTDDALEKSITKIVSESKLEDLTPRIIRKKIAADFGLDKKTIKSKRKTIKTIIDKVISEQPTELKNQENTEPLVQQTVSETENSLNNDNNQNGENNDTNLNSSEPSGIANLLSDITKRHPDDLEEEQNENLQNTEPITQIESPKKPQTQELEDIFDQNDSEQEPPSEAEEPSEDSESDNDKKSKKKKKKHKKKHNKKKRKRHHAINDEDGESIDVSIEDNNKKQKITQDDSRIPQIQYKMKPRIPEIAVEQKKRDSFKKVVIAPYIPPPKVTPIKSIVEDDFDLDDILGKQDELLVKSK